MSDFEVPEAIICSPFDEPTHYWRLEEGAEPEKRPGRRPAIYYYPDPISQDSASGDQGFEDLAEVKSAAADRRVAAVNADGRMGTWHYAIARKVEEVRRTLDQFTGGARATTGQTESAR